MRARVPRAHYARAIPCAYAIGAEPKVTEAAYRRRAVERIRTGRTFSMK